MPNRARTSRAQSTWRGAELGCAAGALALPGGYCLAPIVGPREPYLNWLCTHVDDACAHPWLSDHRHVCRCELYHVIQNLAGNVYAIRPNIREGGTGRGDGCRALQRRTSKVVASSPQQKRRPAGMSSCRPADRISALTSLSPVARLFAVYSAEISTCMIERSLQCCHRVMCAGWCGCTRCCRAGVRDDVTQEGAAVGLCQQGNHRAGDRIAKRVSFTGLQRHP